MENANADKKVLVTGASGGIGRACAVEAAKAGYYVICHYNGSKAKAEETLAEITAAGGQGELIQFNISDREDCKAKLDEMLTNGAKKAREIAKETLKNVKKTIILYII